MRVNFLTQNTYRPSFSANISTFQVSKDELSELLKTKSVKDIAKMYNVMPNVVYARMRKFNLNKRPSDDITKNELYNLIYKKKLPADEIANHYKVSVSTVYEKIAKYGFCRPGDLKVTVEEDFKPELIEPVVILINSGVKDVEIAKKFNMTLAEFKYFKAKNDLNEHRLDKNTVEKTIRPLADTYPTGKELANKLGLAQITALKWFEKIMGVSLAEYKLKSLVSAFEKGLSDEEIAAKFKLTQHHVLKRRKELGFFEEAPKETEPRIQAVPKKRPSRAKAVKMPKEEYKSVSQKLANYKVIEDLSKQNYTDEQIAVVLNKTPKYVKKIKWKLGIKSETKAQANKKRTYETVMEDAKNGISSEETAKKLNRSLNYINAVKRELNIDYDAHRATQKDKMFALLSDDIEKGLNITQLSLKHNLPYTKTRHYYKLYIEEIRQKKGE